MAHADDLYGTFGSVPTTEATGAAGGPVNVRANGNDFGQQIGEAKQNFGQAKQKFGDQVFDVAMQQQKIVNETEMTNADINFAKKAGTLKAQYMSLTGLAATNAFPTYQESLEQARLEARQGLNPAAAHGYDSLSTRTTANHIIDGSTYAASQMKAAQRDSASSLMDISVNAAGDPMVANNDERFNQHLGDIQYAAAMQVGDPSPGSGLKEHPETGAVNFDLETPEGRMAKETHDATVEHATGLAWQNRFQTLANQDPIKAKEVFEAEKDKIPATSAVAIDAFLQPKVQDHNAGVVTSVTLNHANYDHEKELLNPVNPVDTIMKNELHADGVIRVHSDGDGSAIGGINSEAFPAQFLEAKTLLESKGQDAAKDYIKDFYQTEIVEKNGIDKLPANVQNIVADGVTNHWGGFQKELVTAAKNGASPQQLIDMRRNEYQRLATANPTKYGDYLQAWNNRLDSLQDGEGKTAAQKAKPYATNPDGSPVTRADYYAANKDKIIEAGNRYAEQKMPGDLEFKNMVRSRLENQISTAISSQSANYKQDNNYIQKGITGALSKGSIPTTYEELRALPGMADALDRSAVHSPEYTKNIDTQISKMAHQNTSTNSVNGFDTIMRVLQPHGSDNPNAIASQDHLARLLGRNDGTGISAKDYNDAKPLIEADQTFKDALAQNMKQIANANGNVDGKGQERALQWYSQVMVAKQANEKLGDKALPDSEFVANIGKKYGPPMPSPPSRMQQIYNLATKKSQQYVEPGLGKDRTPIFASPDDPEFAKLPSGAKFMVNGETTPRTKK